MTKEKQERLDELNEHFFDGRLITAAMGSSRYYSDRNDEYYSDATYEACFEAREYIRLLKAKIKELSGITETESELKIVCLADV